MRQQFASMKQSLDRYKIVNEKLLFFRKAQRANDSLIAEIDSSEESD